MKMKLLILKNNQMLRPLTISISAIVIGDVILNSSNIISTFVKTIANFLLIEFEMPIWLIILISIILFFSKDLFLFIYRNEFLKYNEENINSIIWKWDYDLSSNKKYIIMNLKAYCPLCKCELSFDQHDYYYCTDSECKNNNGLDIYKIDIEKIVKVIKVNIQKNYPSSQHKIG